MLRIKPLCYFLNPSSPESRTRGHRAVDGRGLDPQIRCVCMCLSDRERERERREKKRRERLSEWERKKEER
jgi:hypothetical protein